MNGCVSSERYGRFLKDEVEFNRGLHLFTSRALSPQKWNEVGIPLNSDGKKREYIILILISNFSVLSMISNTNMTYQILEIVVPEFRLISKRIREVLWNEGIF